MPTRLLIVRATRVWCNQRSRLCVRTALCQFGDFEIATHRLLSGAQLVTRGIEGAVSTEVAVNKDELVTLIGDVITDVSLSLTASERITPVIVEVGGGGG